ncbi:MAG: exosome complex protein Rrp42 [Nanoarchaeota archaeon]
MDIANVTLETFKKLFSTGQRFDLRKLDEYRNIELGFDVSNCAEGSARVKIGKTEVIVGVKMNLDAPYPDSPDKGNIMVSAELLPLASPRFEHGPPKFEGIELPRLVDRAIRESGVIQLDKLVVTPGEKVWTVIIDIYPINDDGNLIDAATIGAIAALRKAKLPGITEKNTPDYKKRTNKSLPLNANIPLSISFYKLGNSIYLDPTREEEEATDVKVTWGISDWNGKMMIHSCQKSGKITFTQSEIESMMNLIEKKYLELNAKLKKLI